MPSLAPAPEEAYTWPLYALASRLAGTKRFQERCGLVYPEPEAEQQLLQGQGGQQRIFYPCLREDDFASARLPCAVIQFGDTWDLLTYAGGEKNHFGPPDGTLKLILADSDKWNTPTTQATDFERSARDFANWVGGVIRDLADIAGENTNLSIKRFSQQQPPSMSPKEEQTTLGFIYWTAVFQIEYGV